MAETVYDPGDDAPATCAFCVAVERVASIDDSDPIVEHVAGEAVVNCHRETPAGHSFCLFHQLPSDREEVPAIYDDCKAKPATRATISDDKLAQLFRRTILGVTEDNGDTCEVVPSGLTHDATVRHRNQFVGAQFGSIKLTYDNINPADNYPIDLRESGISEIEWSHANIGKDIRLTGATVEGGVSLNSATVMGDVSLGGATVERDVSLGGATVERDVSLGGATVEGGVWLGGATVEGDVSLRDATVEGEVLLHGATIEGDVLLNDATVEGVVRLHDATVEGDVSLHDATVERDVSLGGATVERGVLLNNASFMGEVLLGGATVERDVSLRGATVEGGVWLNGTVEGNVSLNRATVKGGVSLNSATVEGGVSLGGATVEGNVSLNRATVEGGVSLGGATVGGYVSLSGAAVEGDVSLNRATVEGEVSLAYVTVEGEVSLRGASVNKTVNLSGCAIESGVCLDKTTADGLHVPFDQSVGARGMTLASELGNGGIMGPLTARGISVNNVTLESDTLGHPGVRAVLFTNAKLLTSRGGNQAKLSYANEAIARDRAAPGITDSRKTNGVLFDLHGATLGNVSLDGPSLAPFEYHRFRETTFDAFAFSSNRNKFRSTSWRLDQTRTNGHRDIAAVAAFETTDDSKQSLENEPGMSGAKPGVPTQANKLIKALCELISAGKFEPTRPESSDMFTTHDTFVKNIEGDADWEDLLFGPVAFTTEREVYFDPITRILQKFESFRMTDMMSIGSQSNTIGDTRVIDTLQDLSEIYTEQTDITLLTEALEYRVRTEKTPFAAARRAFSLYDRIAGTFEYRSSMGAPIADGVISTLLTEITEGQPSTELERIQSGEYSLDTNEVARACLDIAVEYAPNITDNEPVFSPPTERAEIRDHRPFWLSIERLADALFIEIDETVRPSLVARVFETVRVTTTVKNEPTQSDGGNPHTKQGGTETPLSGEETASGVGAAFDPDATTPRPERPRVYTAESKVDPRKYIDNDDTEEFDYDAVSGLDLVPDEFTAVGKWRLQLEASIARARAVQRYGCENGGHIRASEELVGTPAELESTYVKAKRDAIAQGDQVAAGEFFRLEQTFAREQHWRRISGQGPTQHSETTADENSRQDVRTRLGGAKDWVSNVFLWATIGYGERPLRVVGSALAVIGAFALTFDLIHPADAPLPYGSEWGFLIFSVGSFVTLLPTAPMSTMSPLTNSLAVIEGFLGVSFVALIVFTLTRSIQR